jgi:probable rRNA maturation factor
MRELQVRNRQRDRALNVKFVRELTRALLEEELGLGSYELGISFVSAKRMAEINHEFLQHEGSTDVITFDFRDGYESANDGEFELAGEIYISVSDAQRQAREFETRWEEEIVRYIVHGVLHLRGYDDLSGTKRKVMKREEDRLLRRMKRSFDFRRLAK